MEEWWRERWARGREGERAATLPPFLSLTRLSALSAPGTAPSINAATAADPYVSVLASGLASERGVQNGAPT